MSILTNHFNVKDYFEVLIHRRNIVAARYTMNDQMTITTIIIYFFISTTDH